MLNRPDSVNSTVISLGIPMYFVNFLIVFLLVGCLVGCQKKPNNMASEPEPYEMKVGTMTKHASIEGAEITKHQRLSFSSLADVQNHLRSLEWQNPDIRYEIEVLLRGNQRPGAKLDIKNFGDPPIKFEFVFREDITKPNTKTRIVVGPAKKDLDTTANMVATMTRQAFDHHKDRSEDNTK